jgi:hypothetical protein
MPASNNVLPHRESDKENFRYTDSFQEYLLAELGSARLKSQLWTNHLDTIGIAPKANLITPEQAAGELKEGGYWGELIVEGLR